MILSKRLWAKIDPRKCQCEQGCFLSVVMRLKCASCSYTQGEYNLIKAVLQDSTCYIKMLNWDLLQCYTNIIVE